MLDCAGFKHCVCNDSVNEQLSQHGKSLAAADAGVHINKLAMQHLQTCSALTSCCSPNFALIVGTVCQHSSSKLGCLCLNVTKSFMQSRLCPSANLLTWDHLVLSQSHKIGYVIQELTSAPKACEKACGKEVLMYCSTVPCKLDALILGQSMFSGVKGVKSLKPQGIFLSASMTLAQMVQLLLLAGTALLFTKSVLTSNHSYKDAPQQSKCIDRFPIALCLYRGFPYIECPYKEKLL